MAGGSTARLEKHLLQRSRTRFGTDSGRAGDDFRKSFEDGGTARNQWRAGFGDVPKAVILRREKGISQS